jgi:hypothetical protein
LRLVQYSGEKFVTQHFGTFTTQSALNGQTARARVCRLLNQQRTKGGPEAE